MKENELFDLIKAKLEEEGTSFSTYYGDTIIYRDGPKPSKFFKRVNEGNYSIEILIIPKEFYIKSINIDAVTEFLK